MKGKIVKLILVITIVFGMLTSLVVVSATEYATVNANGGVILRKGPSTSESKILTIPQWSKVTVLEKNIPSKGGCDNSTWSRVSFDGKEGYACGKFLDPFDDTPVEIPETDMAKMSDEEFDAYLTKQGFPDTYKDKLKTLHKAHPNWVFVGIKTRSSWSTILTFQYGGAKRNLYQSTSTSTQGYLSTDDGYYDWYTDKFTPKEGSTWYKANKETIAYFMDPRNFLNESGIFMFEDLNYYSSYQTSDAVKAVLYTDFYKDLIQYYIDAAEKYNVSPIYLAALSRQEVGLNGGTATNGKAASTCGSGLNGYYNFYNIGANTGVCDGMRYAKEQNWNSKKTAIINGASWIVSGYINAGQNTPYFQKFNVSSNATKDMSHQYMANVAAVKSSAASTTSSYSSMRIIDFPIVFQIPIYSGIPDKVSALPPTGNPNNYLKTLKVNGASVTNFDGATTSYTVNVPSTTTSVTIAATTVNTGSKIAINSGSKVAKTTSSSVKIGEGTTSIPVVVTAGNGSTKKYTVKVVKQAPVVSKDDQIDGEKNNGNEGNTKITTDQTVTSAGYKINSSTYMTNVTLGSTVAGMISKLEKANAYASINITNSSNKAKTSGSIVTGDKVSISSNGTTKTYTIVIFGDLNGDGEISIVDLGMVQKHLLNKSKLSGAYLKASDTDKNGSVSIVDLGVIQKHLLKVSNISQS